MYAQPRNQYVLSAAAAQLVTAYKTLIAEYAAIMPLERSVSADAPETFEGLQANAAKGQLIVTDAHSDTSIYGGAGNVTFRFFHDYGHLLYNKQFVTVEEVELAQLQWADIEPVIPAEWRATCKIVYMADTVEQSLYCDQTGEFPVDQKAFVLHHLNNQLKLAFTA